MPNEPTNNESRLTISIPISRFMHEYTLGPQPFCPIHIEEAKIIKILEPQLPSAHVQMEDLNTGESLKRPLLWWSKDWYQDVKRREIAKQQSEIRRNAAVKQTENLQKVTTFLMEKYKLPHKAAYEAAQEMILDRGATDVVVETLKLLNISLDKLSPDEQKSFGSNYTIIK